MGRCQRHGTRNECSAQNRGGQVLRNDTSRVRSGPAADPGRSSATATGPHESDAERDRSHERHRGRIDDQIASERGRPDRFYQRYWHRAASGGSGFDLRSFSYDETTGHGYGVDHHPLDRGSLRRTRLGHPKSGAGCDLLFHASHPSRGACMKDAAVPIVFIIDDDAGMRQAIQDLVESVDLRAECFTTGEEFLRKQRTSDPCCLVLDVRLPQMSGLDFQHRLAEIGLQIPIIFITAHGDIPMSVKALKSGAVEFLTKPFRDQDLLDAIQQALQRDRVTLKEQAEVHDLQERYRALTAREQEVMTLVVSGMLNKQVASEIGVSEATVKIHRGNVMHKMQAASVVDLVRMADKLKSSPRK